MNSLKIDKVEITSSFWKRYRSLIAKKSVPFQWAMISDQKKPEVTSKTVAGGASEKSNAIENLRIAAGKAKGHHQGMIFQDTDVYKWLETVAYVLQYDYSEDLKNLADQVIDLIADAQDDSGYLSTRYQIDTPKLKFKQLQQSHELYSMGHYIEAGVAYYLSTGNAKALEIAKKMANCIGRNFGEGKNKIHGYDGHPEIELALTKLYECTKDNKYLKLANFFVQERGTQPDFFKGQNEQNDIKDDPFPDMRNANDNYFFDDRPLVKENTAQGHAVRVLYFLTGAAHVARLTQNPDLIKAVERLWNDIAERQMYITGNVGQTAVGEAFTYDYDLPNKTDYGETCASVAMIMFAKQMEQIEMAAKYGDILEKELYNGALAGISLDGEHYFYANPLEISKASHLNPASSHLAMRRMSWFSCACCPANITRLIASLDKYIYVLQDNKLLLDQLISNQLSLNNQVSINVDSSLPWDKQVRIQVSNPKKIEFDLKIRIPSWSKQYQVKVNGKELSTKAIEGILTIPVKENLEIELELDLSIRMIHANPKVTADYGKVAIQRGPIIYCAEQVDNPGDYSNYQVPENAEMKAEFDQHLLEGIEKVRISHACYVEEKELYNFDTNQEKIESRPLILVPYYAWANREEGSMNVWLNERKEEERNE